MSEPDQLLDVLQADIVAVLKNTPALSDAFIFTGSEKDLATRLNKTFGTRTDSSGGKRGLGIQVLPIFTDAAENNLPGPPFMLRCQILIIENVRLNRAASTGTLKTSSQAALNILNLLHLHTISGHAMYADNKPIVPEKMDDGFEGHVVTVNVQGSGIAGPGKVAAIHPQLNDGIGGESGGMTVSGAITPDITGDLLAAGTMSGVDSWTTDGTQTPAVSGSWAKVFFPMGPESAGSWELYAYEDAAFVAQWSAPYQPDGYATAGPDGLTYSAQTGATGTATVTAAGEATITLTCATAGASIYYTTDGTYPTPDNGTLYAAPFNAPELGTTIRAAGYKTGLNPGDCLEFTLVDLTPDGTITDGDLALADADGSILTDL